MHKRHLLAILQDLDAAYLQVMLNLMRISPRDKRKVKRLEQHKQMIKLQQDTIINLAL